MRAIGSVLLNFYLSFFYAGHSLTDTHDHKRAHPHFHKRKIREFSVIIVYTEYFDAPINNIMKKIQ